MQTNVALETGLPGDTGLSRGFVARSIQRVVRQSQDRSHAMTPPGGLRGVDGFEARLVVHIMLKFVAGTTFVEHEGAGVRHARQRASASG